MAEVKWIKITTDIFDDEKIAIIEQLPSADSIITIWFKMLVLAGKQNNGGVFLMNNRIAYTDEMLAAIFRRDIALVRMALNTFRDLGMIEIVESVFTIPNWNKHQSLDAYERKKTRDRIYQSERREKQRIAVNRAVNVGTNHSIVCKNDTIKNEISKKSSDNRLTSVDTSYDNRLTSDDESSLVVVSDIDKDIDIDIDKDIDKDINNINTKEEYKTLKDFKDIEKEKEKRNIKEKEKAKEKNQNLLTISNEIVVYLNSVVGTRYTSKNKDTQKHIIARIKEGYTIEDFKDVINFKFHEWGEDPVMSQYLRPQTLFCNKFESYLQNAKRSNAMNQSTMITADSDDDDGWQ